MDFLSHEPVPLISARALSAYRRAAAALLSRSSVWCALLIFRKTLLIYPLSHDTYSFASARALLEGLSSMQPD